MGNMGNSRDEVMEAEISRVARKAFKQLLKDIRSEPRTLVIEPGDNKDNISGDTIADIRAWLFRKE